MKKIRFGIMGIGHQGKNYAELLRNGKIKNGLLTAVCSSNREIEKLCNNEYEGIIYYNNFTEMLKSGHIDAVIICVPHYLHPELGIEAINNNIHILVEKPVGVYAKQVRELNELSESKSNVSFAMFYNLRMNPIFRKIKEIVEEGEIGELRRISWLITDWWRPQLYYDQSRWKGTWKGEGGGILLNQAPHQLDLIQWICGMPKKIYSNINYGFKRNISVEDDVTAIFEYENGATGIFVTCTHDLMGTDRLEIHGDLGKIIVDGSKKLTIMKLHKPEEEYNREATMEDIKKLVDEGSIKDLYDEKILDFDSHGKGYHSELIENFVENILEGTPLIAPGIEGINQVLLANGMYLSSWLNKEIELPIDEDLYIEELNKKIEEEKN